jgi:hypothetical protein
MEGAMAEPTDPRLDPLLGSWRLISLGATFVDTKERLEVYGPHPSGYMVLSANGRVIFLFARAGREAPRSDPDRAALFSTMTAYSGVVRIEAAGQFVVTVDLAWDPGWSGEQTRYFTLEGDRLTIRTAEQTHPQTGDRRMVGDLVWERET